jgi:hypothetical protein
MWKLDGNQMLKHTKEYVSVKESWFYNYAATSKQLCKYLIPYVIKFILINWIKLAE